MFVITRLLILCIFFHVYNYVKCEEKMKVPSARKRGCTDPPGNIGDFLIQGCRRKTCRRKGRKAVWVETFESKKCCNYDQQWYEMGDTIKEMQSTDTCTSATIICANNQGNSQIRIKTENKCNEYLETEMREHANKSDMNNKNLEDKIDGVETLLQIFLNKTDSNHPSPGYSDTTTTRRPSLSQSQEVLFLGPGRYSKGKSEVVLIPSLTPANCTPPTFPGEELYGYVGIMTADGPLLCGGFTDSNATSKCHLLAKSGNWFGTPPLVGMSLARGHMAAVEMNDGWFVTGGYDKNSPTSISEIWYNNTWNKYTSLPKATYGHCMVRLNSTHSLLTGGSAEPKATYIFSKKSWIC